MHYNCSTYLTSKMQGKIKSAIEENTSDDELLVMSSKAEIDYKKGRVKVLKSLRNLVKYDS